MNKNWKIFWTTVICASLLFLTLFIRQYNKGDILTSASRQRDPSLGEIIILEPPVPMAESVSKDSLEYKSFTRINEIRQENGLRVLSYSASLSNDAIVRAQECGTLFSHTRPNGTDWYTVDPDIMYGENLAQAFTDANVLVQAWMNSPTHRELILTGDYNTCGIGTYTIGGVTYVACEFGY